MQLYWYDPRKRGIESISVVIEGTNKQGYETYALAGMKDTIYNFYRHVLLMGELLCYASSPGHVYNVPFKSYTHQTFAKYNR